MSILETRGPALERAAAVALGAETLAVVGWLVVTVVAWIGGRTTDAGATGFVVGFAALCACATGAATFGLWRGKRWARSVAVLWQFFEVAVALAAGSTLLTLALLAPVPVVLVGVAAAGMRAPRPAASRPGTPASRSPRR